MNRCFFCGKPKGSRIWGKYCSYACYARDIPGRLLVAGVMLLIVFIFVVSIFRNIAYFIGAGSILAFLLFTGIFMTLTGSYGYFLQILIPSSVTADYTSYDSEVLFEVRGLKKWFPVRSGIIASLMRRQEYVHAVDGISFNIRRGEVVCLVGESGSGKTTTARVLLRLEDPTDGEIHYKGIDFAIGRARRLRKYRKHLQMIFQNPYEALDPRMTIFDILTEPLNINKVCEKKEIPEKIITALEEVGLIPPDEFLGRFPHELSGGQRQRICIARTLVLNPEFNIADEPASMLDASTRIEILNLLSDLNSKRDMALLFITHDLAQARYLGDKINVMYLGKIVESGDVELVIKSPHHPYTQVLISNIPVPDPSAQRERLEIEGEIPTAINLPPGCRFSPRCPFVFEKCRQEEPELMKKNGRLSACWLD